jgi:hypothetical protein
MSEHNAAIFHHLYGARKPRTCFYRRDFVDYSLMVLVTALVVGLSYGIRHPMSFVAFALCLQTFCVFIVRHGVEFRVPLILRRPQDLLYMVVYKIQNLKSMWFIAVGLLLLENFLIGATPNLPHHVDWMRTFALWLFYTHFLVITVFRTAVLADHLMKRELVREVLMQTPWKRTINRKTNITLEIWHAYATGLLTHIAFIAPWYLLITHVRYSLMLLPAVFLIDAFVQWRWAGAINSWFYREHWVGHNSELEFLFLHGMHHDAIPSALIAVGENGFLEGFCRILGSPVPFYNPLAAFVFNTYDVVNDMQTHQYIPGVFPKLPRWFLAVAQHATHHFGQLEPYGFGLKVDQPGMAERVNKSGLRRMPNSLKNSIELDEELTGFKWDNPTYRRTLGLYEQYQRRVKQPQAEGVA